MRIGGIILVVIGAIVLAVGGLDDLGYVKFHPVNHTSAILAGIGIVLLGIGIITAILGRRPTAS